MAPYTPATDLFFTGGSYTPGADFDFATATEVSAQLNAVLQATLQRQAELDAVLVQGRWAELTVDAEINPPPLRAIVDAVRVRNQLLAAALDALVQQLRVGSVGLDALIAVIDARIVSADLEAVISASQELAASIDAVLQAREMTTISALLSAALLAAPTTRTAMLGAVLTSVRKHAVFPDAWLLGTHAITRVARARLDANLLPAEEDMALSFSTGLRNHLLGNYARADGDGLGGAMHNCFIDLYAGNKPASPDYPPVFGTYLGTFQLSENPYSNEWGGSWTPPLAGSIHKENWQDWQMQCVRAGTPGWFRMRLIDDLNDYSTNAHRIDGTVGPVAGDYDLVMRDTALVVDRLYHIDSFVMTMRQEN